MKTPTTALMILGIGFSSHAQNPTQSNVHPVYTHGTPASAVNSSQGKRRRDTGATLTLLGAALMISGVAVFTDGSDSNVGIYPVPKDDSQAQGGAILFGAGLGMFIPGVINWAKGAKQMKGLPSGRQPAKLAEIATEVVSEITTTSAKSGGNITSDGGTSVTERGVCWSVHPSPTINDMRTVDGPGGGLFASVVNGLKANTVYFIRAYAITDAGVTYGLSYSFSTNQ